MRIFSTYSAKIKNYNHIFKKNSICVSGSCRFYDPGLSSEMGRHPQGRLFMFSGHLC